MTPTALSAPAVQPDSRSKAGDRQDEGQGGPDDGGSQQDPGHDVNRALGPPVQPDSRSRASAEADSGHTGAGAAT